MSHTVKILTQFTSAERLKEAFKALGWTIGEKTKIRTYPHDPVGQRVFDWAGVNPRVDGYGVGIEMAEGRCETFCDFYGGSVAASLGTDLCRLRTEYTAKVAEHEFAMMGAECTRTTESNGDVYLTATLQ